MTAPAAIRSPADTGWSRCRNKQAAREGARVTRQLTRPVTPPPPLRAGTAAPDLALPSHLSRAAPPRPPDTRVGEAAATPQAITAVAEHRGRREDSQESRGWSR